MILVLTSSSANARSPWWMACQNCALVGHVPRRKDVSMDLPSLFFARRERVQFSSPLRPDIAADRVRQRLAQPIADPTTGPWLSGWVRDSGILMAIRRPGQRNAWAPTVHGQLTAAPSGSVFSGVVGPQPPVEVFLGFWSGFACLGMAIGVAVALAGLAGGHYRMAGQGALVVAAGIASLGLLAGLGGIGRWFSRDEAEPVKALLAEALTATERP